MSNFYEKFRKKDWKMVLDTDCKGSRNMAIKPLRNKIMPFNAIIEGFLDSRSFVSYYKLTNIEIPRGAAVLNDLFNRYILYGIANNKNLDKIQVVNSKGLNPKEGLETKIDSLALCDGVVIGSAGSILGLPRTIYMRDGRIYVNSEIKDKYYSNKLYHVNRLSSIESMFKNELMNDLYRSEMRKHEMRNR